MVLQGRIQQVTTRTIGALLEGDHVAGATVLLVNDVSPFSDGGGDEVQIESTVHTVTSRQASSVEDVPDRLVVSPALTAAMPSGTAVTLLPVGEETVATVSIDDNPEDAIEIFVSYEFKDIIPDGVRDYEDQESVEVELRNGRYALVDVVGRTPVIKSDYLDIDPVTEQDAEVIRQLAQKALDDAAKAIQDVQDLDGYVDGLPRTFRQPDKPTNGKINDTWYDTDDGNKIYVHNGTDFVSVQDASIAQLQAAVAAAEQAAEQAQTDATSALGDAEAAFNRAEAVKTEAAADATSKASAAQTAATIASLEALFLNRNNTFSDWTGTYPNHYAAWQGPAPTKDTALARSGPFGMRSVVAAAADQVGVSLSSTLNVLPNLEYFYVEVEVYLVSGTSLSGAGVVLDWNGMTNNRGLMSLGSLAPNPTAGRWYKLGQVVRRPTNATGTFSSMGGFLMSNWSGLGTMAAKTIVWGKFGVRGATVEEITAFNAPADAQSKATAAQNAATTAAAADASTKASNAQTAAINAAAADATTKASNAQTAAINAAATDATTKANNAKQAAIDAAATDAQTKANTAKQAAIDAAAADATSKAASAEAAAKAAAATDAQTKADAAKQAAISAAATDASQKANAAEVAALEAAAVDAQQKADAAKAEAQTAAAADATSKANAAEAAAKAAAATDAAAKAEAARAAAVSAAAADATDKATAAVASAYLNRNPTFAEWTAALPTGVIQWAGTPVPVKNTSTFRTPPWSMDFNATDTNDRGVDIGGLLNGYLPYAEYVTVEAEVYLVSGNFSGAGILLDWTGTTAPNRTTVNFHTLMPSPTTGRWYRFTQVLKRPTATGTWTGWSAWLMANYASGLSAKTAKRILVDRVGFRPASVEEITAYNAPADAAAKASTAKSEAITAAASDATSKANTAQSNAISAAASDATTKANNAVSTAATNAATQYGETKTLVSGWRVTGKTTINGGVLETDSVKAGAVDAYAITSKHTIVGATFMTEATAARGIKFNSAALLAYNTSGVVTFSIDAATGNVGLKGSLYAGSDIQGANVTGTVTVVGGKFQTSATANRGIEITSTSLTAYDGSGAVTFQITSATGAVTMKGSLSAGSSIDGATVTGGTVQTIATASRGIKITTAGLTAFNGSGAATFSIDAATGAVAMLGTLQAGSTIAGAAITGTVSVSGGVLQTSTTAARGIKITDTGLDAYDVNGAVTFQIVGATGSVSMLGTLTSGSNIVGSRFTGGVIETSTSTSGVPRVTLDAGNGVVVWDANNQYRTWLRADGSASFKGTVSTEGSLFVSGSLVIQGTSTSYVYNGGQLISLGQEFSEAGVYALMSGGYLECGVWTPGTNAPKTKLRPSAIEFEQTTGARGFISSSASDELRMQSYGHMGFNVADNRNFVFRLGAGNSFFAIQTLSATSGNTPLVASSSGILYRSTSSLRYKQDVQALSVSDYPILDVEAVKFRNRDEMAAYEEIVAEAPFVAKEPQWYVGVIAEQLEEIGLTEVVVYDEQGRPDAVMYDKLSMLMLPVLKDQQERIEKLERALETLLP